MPRTSSALQFRREVRVTAWRVKVMGELLDRWDEYEATQNMPPDVRCTLVEEPELSRELVQELHSFLLERLKMLEDVWERRS